MALPNQIIISVGGVSVRFAWVSTLPGYKYVYVTPSDWTVPPTLTFAAGTWTLFGELTSSGDGVNSTCAGTSGSLSLTAGDWTNNADAPITALAAATDANYTDPGVANVKSTTSYTFAGASQTGTLDLTNLAAANVKGGVTIGGVAGTYVGTGTNGSLAWNLANP